MRIRAGVCPPRVLSRIFDPYFTTRERGMVRAWGCRCPRNRQSHRGTICCRSAPGQGTTIEIYFPEIGNTSEETVPVVTTRMPKPGKMVFVEEAGGVRAGEQGSRQQAVPAKR